MYLGSCASARSGFDSLRRRELQRTADLFGYKDVALRIGQAYAKSGGKSAASVYAREIERANETGQLWRPIMVADAYDRAGDRDKTWRWLQKAAEMPDFQLGIPLGNPSGALVKLLRSNARFQELIRRLRLPQ